MRIQSCAVYKGSTYEIIFEEGGRIYLSSEIVRSKALKDGTELSRQEVAALMYMQQYRKAKERALYIIEAGDISFKGLYEKLEKNYSQRVCLDVCKKMVSIGLIDDRKYGAKLAARLFEVKLFGYYRAKQEMKRKGVPDELIEELCAEYSDTAQDRLAELIGRKYASKLDDENGVRKVKAALARMGYSYSNINEAMKSFGDDEDE